ncbi:MAG: biotin--[acetyl-CoA-carboxylase] ligase [Lachnospiraceae bacterium]|nr:biotin--[acetyl-CoA-carboxylase] ligase [Lachnospiraceae bacterium]
MSIEKKGSESNEQKSGTSLQPKCIRDSLQTKWLGRNLVVLEETGSTNEDVKRLAREGATEGTLVTANMQSAGKGSKGRHWQSPAGEALYFSFLLRPVFSPQKASMLTLVIAHSLAVALQKFLKNEEQKHSIGIKWPNDIVMEQKKLCGILTEMSATMEGIDYVVIGTGVNVNNQSFPEEVADKATSLALLYGKEFSREQLLTMILEEFEKDYAIFLETEDLSGLKEDYEKHLLNKGEQVRILDSKGEYTGLAKGISDQGELLVERDGGVEKIFAGEVSVRGLYSYV